MIEAGLRAFTVMELDGCTVGNSIRQYFGPNPLIVFGNCVSGHHMKHLPPTLGVGILDELHRQGFRIVMVDEFCTSSRCPDCTQAIKPFRKRKSPRPWRRHLGRQMVHGLLRCTSDACRLQGQYKLWNRDLAAVLNFRIIYNSLENARLQQLPEIEGRPADLRR
jgi:hypothetical protein